ncbi:MAG: thiamine diphosphokinase [Clostridia bacterium]|nr:thiamine diphosphokinase [Clostridia bacterium]
MRAVIIGGAPVTDYAALKEYFKEDDFFVLCDSGLYHCAPLGITPDLIIGDFDSHERPDTDIETIQLPTVKDDTDTVFAAKECIRRGFDQMLIAGAIGARLDHSLGNLYLLLYLEGRGVKATVVDDFSEMCIAGQSPVRIDKKFPFFSVLNIDGSASGVTIKNAKYELENAEIAPEYQYGISNEVSGDFATVSVKEGKVLVIRVKKC